MCKRFYSCIRSIKWTCSRNKIFEEKNICNVFNLGTGCGTSVLSLVYNFAKINKVKIPIKIFEKRKGDIDQSFADVKYAMNELNWKSTKSIKTNV